MGKKEEQFNRKRLRLAYISTVISITLVLFIFGLVGLTLLSAQKLSDYVKESLSMELFLQENISEADATLMMSNLNSRAYTKSTQYTSKDKAKETFIKLYGEDFSDFIDYNPLLSSIQLNLKAEYVDDVKIEEIESQLMSEYGDMIAEVTKQKELISAVNSNLKNLGIGLLIFSAILLIIVIALINNTIRLSIYAKRFLIKTMQLVGAKPSFIRRPFVLSGILQGLISAFISVIFLGVVIYQLIQTFPGFFIEEDFISLLILFGAVILSGILLTAISTWFAVRKFLNLRIDNLY
jgi:cell division transport system permease protein